MNDHSNNTNLRLPSIAELVSSTLTSSSQSYAHGSSDAWPSLSQSQSQSQRVNAADSRCTPLAAALPLHHHDHGHDHHHEEPSKLPSWRAINHHPSQHTSTQPSSSSPSPFTPPSHEFPVNRCSPSRSPPRKPPSHPEATTTHGQPITAARQDSTISEATPNASPSSTISRPPTMATFSPYIVGTREFIRYPNHRDALAYPTTPPSSAPSPESRQRISPPATSRPGTSFERSTPRGRAFSDSKTTASPLSMPSSVLRRTRSSRLPAQSNMPPPPSPVSIVSGPSSSFPLLSQEPVPRNPPSNSSQHQPSAESSFTREHASPTPYRRRSPTPTPSLTNIEPPRCYYCKAVWEYTPSNINHVTDPATSKQQVLGEVVDSLLYDLKQRTESEDEQFLAWARQHWVELRYENSTVPCPPCPAAQERDKGRNKRKADSPDDAQVTSKLRRLSLPAESQLTPPPDPPSTLTQRQRMINVPTTSLTIPLPDYVGAILKLPGIRPYVDQDTDIMFSRPKSRTGEAPP
ncbi:hypothetical protein CC80DRAFT_240258 [Byssothecium circinans]|uniref:Uncharacterized protein n=1 Tax=Byssothecium circinans TaxID=147558 RepID=A0A6A5TDK4_9PLEO|nr:hypothetical protein CC80DRAFT_240258 [Byssothecium circinans]